MVSIKFWHKTKLSLLVATVATIFIVLQEHSYTPVTRIPDKSKVTRKGVIKILNTVYIGFCDQPPSQGSRSLKPMEVAILSGFPLGIATRQSLKAILV